LKGDARYLTQTIGGNQMVQNTNRPNGMNGQDKIPLIETEKVIKYKGLAEKAKQPDLFPSSEPPTTFTMSDLEEIKNPPKPGFAESVKIWINETMDARNRSTLNTLMMAAIVFQTASHSLGFGQLLEKRGIYFLVGCLLGILGSLMLEGLMHVLVVRGAFWLPLIIVGFSGGFGYYAWHTFAEQGTFEFWLTIALTFMPPSIIFQLAKGVFDQEQAEKLKRDADKARKIKLHKDWKDENVIRARRGEELLPLPEELQSAFGKKRGKSLSAYEELVIVNAIADKGLWDYKQVCKHYDIGKTKAYELISYAYQLRDKNQAKSESTNSAKGEIRNLRKENQSESTNPSQNSNGGKN